MWTVNVMIKTDSSQVMEMQMETPWLDSIRKCYSLDYEI